MYECPEDISEQAICINGDIGAVIDEFDTICVDNVGWRYDPIFVDDKHNLDWHINQFEQMAATLSGYTKTCVISFLDIYKKVERNFPDAREVFKKDRLTIGKVFIEIAKRHDIYRGIVCDQ